MIYAFLQAVFQFMATASDPQWTCSIAHREPDVAATILLHCTRTIGDVEIVQVGKYVPDGPTN